MTAILGNQIPNWEIRQSHRTAEFLSSNRRNEGPALRISTFYCIGTTPSIRSSRKDFSYDVRVRGLFPHFLVSRR